MASTIDTTPSSVATSALQAIPFGSIIGGPLKACVEAQADAAMTTWNFIKEVGLTEDKNGNRKLNYVSFSYRKNGRDCHINVPLLTIVPIPYIAIRDIDIAFKAKISAAASTSETKKESLAVDFSNKTKVSGGGLLVRASTEFNVGVSSKKDSTATRDSKYSVEYTMDVAVKAGQDDIPAGMAKILEILNESVDTIEKGGELHVSSQVVRLNSEDLSQRGVYITYKDEEGYYISKSSEAGLTIKKLAKDGGTFESAIKGESYDISDDEPGMVCMFKETGTYQIAKGEKRVTVHVIE